jgi:hypothetical protein
VIAGVARCENAHAAGTRARAVRERAAIAAHPAVRRVGLRVHLARVTRHAVAIRGTRGACDRTARTAAAYAGAWIAARAAVRRGCSQVGLASVRRVAIAIATTR